MLTGINETYRNAVKQNPRRKWRDQRPKPANGRALERCQRNFIVGPMGSRAIREAENADG
jgi:hypothetical protein